MRCIKTYDDLCDEYLFNNRQFWYYVLLVNPKDLSRAGEALLNSLDYFHRDSGSDVTYFLPGFLNTDRGIIREIRSFFLRRGEIVRIPGYGDVKFFQDDFIDFCHNLQTRNHVEWRYSGECELLFFNVGPNGRIIMHEFASYNLDEIVRHGRNLSSFLRLTIDIGADCSDRDKAKQRLDEKYAEIINRPGQDAFLHANSYYPSGSCGENLTWELKGGVLAIRGTGEMECYNSENMENAILPPWSQLRDSIQRVAIQNGVTSIGSFAFYRCENLSEAEIPESVIRIGSLAFHKCPKLEKVLYYGSESQWEKLRITRGDGNDKLLEPGPSFVKAAVPDTDEKPDAPQLPAAEPAALNIPRSDRLPQPYSGDQPYIFFSYAHKNKETALKLIRLLQNSGFRVWYDEGIELTVEYPMYIADQVKKCSCMVSLISQAYLDAEFCKKEIFYAERNHIPQLLIYLEDVSLPGDWDLIFGLFQSVPYKIFLDEQRLLEKLLQTDNIGKCREG